jgi:hypothetical protein
LSGRDVLEPLTPELALIDPDLARLARDRLQPPVTVLNTSARRSSVSDVDDEPLAERASRDWASRAENVAHPEHSFGAVSSVPRRVQSELDGASRDAPRAPSRKRWRRRAALATLGVIVVSAGAYALASDSTVREEIPIQTPKKAPAQIHPNGKAQGPTRQSQRAAAKGAPKVSRHPIVLGTRTTGPNSKRPSTFPTRVFIWPTIPHASFYKVEFFRRGRKVFTALPSTPRLELPLHWVYRGRRFELMIGVYSWKVTPAFGPRSGLRYGDPIIRSTWVARR